MSLDTLISFIKEKNNPTVVGLDPLLEYVPPDIVARNFDKYGEGLKGASYAILEFNKRLIDALYEIIPSVKLQAAYYELYGFHGIYAMKETVDYAKKQGLYVILDGKRNDIGSTACAYAAAYLGKTSVSEGKYEAAFDADALTVNPFLGSDGVIPFLSFGKAVFLLLRTSNPSSYEIQNLCVVDRETGKEKSFYLVLADYISSWGKKSIGDNGFSNVGAVVGATHPMELAELRLSMPDTFFLVPGYGAQGADASAVSGAFNKDGMGAIVNASRSVMCAWKNDPQFKFSDFDRAAKVYAEKMRDDILSFI